MSGASPPSKQKENEAEGGKKITFVSEQKEE